MGFGKNPPIVTFRNILRKMGIARCLQRFNFPFLELNLFNIKQIPGVQACKMASVLS